MNIPLNSGPLEKQLEFSANEPSSQPTPFLFCTDWTLTVLGCRWDAGESTVN